MNSWNETEILKHLKNILEEMQNSKTEQRLPIDRSKAVAITELEKVIAYWRVWVIDILDNADE